MNLYEYRFRSITGAGMPLERWKGQPMLLVNTASECGFTPQYADLQKRCGAGQVILLDESKSVAHRLEIKKFPRTYLIGKDYLVKERIDGIPPLMRDEFTEKVRALVQ